MTNLVNSDYVRSYLARLAAVLQSIEPRQIEIVGELLTTARNEGRQVFLCGNGGSAASASHIAVDLGKGCSRNREKRFRVISLTDNVPWMTALSNDISYDDVFVEQLKNYAEKGDIVIAISGSGNSKNVLKALQYANQIGCETIALTGRDGGKLGPAAKLHIRVAEPHMGRIEDGHLIVCHMLCYYFMEN